MFYGSPRNTAPPAQTTVQGLDKTIIACEDKIHGVMAKILRELESINRRIGSHASPTAQKDEPDASSYQMPNEKRSVGGDYREMRGKR
jgi:hypothetical protein